jgi:hypothetical protein
MKGNGLPGPAVPPAPANGVHRSGKKNGTRPNGRPAPELAPEILAAPFAGVEAEPIDSPMWPIHPAGWLQPEAPAAAPSWSGLSIERRNRIPSPDLRHFGLEAFYLPHGPELRCQAFVTAASPVVPVSGLEPLGWDPRALCPKKEVK